MQAVDVSIVEHATMLASADHQIHHGMRAHVEQAGRGPDAHAFVRRAKDLCAESVVELVHVHRTARMLEPSRRRKRIYLSGSGLRTLSGVTTT